MISVCDEKHVIPMLQTQSWSSSRESSSRPLEEEDHVAVERAKRMMRVICAGVGGRIGGVVIADLKLKTFLWWRPMMTRSSRV